MVRSLPVVAVLFALALGLCCPEAALAVYPPAIKDEGKIFGKEAVEKANRKIRELYEKYKRDVVIETIGSLTEEQQKKLKADSATKFWGSYALAREKELGLNGLYIVISKDPKRIEVFADTASRKTIFPNKTREAIYEKIRGQFQSGKFDAGLLDALDAIESALKAGAK